MIINWQQSVIITAVKRVKLHKFLLAAAAAADVGSERDKH